MKKIASYVLIGIILFVGVFSLEVNANLLAECHICNVTGKCDQCYGTLKVKCDQCTNGLRICDQCNGKKTYICDGCNGTGVLEEERVCDRCNGIGNKPCNACNENGYVKCNGCNGTCEKTCNACNGVGTCISCKGTGYLAGKNDGVINVPKNGDTVQKNDGTTIIWGSTKKQESVQSSSPEKNETSKVSNETSKNETVLEKNDEKFEVIEKEEEVIDIVITKDTVTGSFDSTKMNDNEKAVYAEKTKKEKENLISDVKYILESYEFDKITYESEEVIANIMRDNGIKEKQDAKICGLRFEGHISLDAPISVSVKISDDIYNKEDIIYVYHILYNSKVELIGEAEKKIENGKVIGITFETNGFSDFFCSDRILTLNGEVQENIGHMDIGASDIAIGGNTSTTISKDNCIIIVGIVILLLIIVVLLIIKSKKNKKGDEK